MEIEDTKIEVSLVSIDVGITLQGLDSTVHGFQFAGADAMVSASSDRQTADESV